MDTIYTVTVGENVHVTLTGEGSDKLTTEIVDGVVKIVEIPEETEEETEETEN